MNFAPTFPGMGQRQQPSRSVRDDLLATYQAQQPGMPPQPAPQMNWHKQQPGNLRAALAAAMRQSMGLAPPAQQAIGAETPQQDDALMGGMNGILMQEVDDWERKLKQGLLPQPGGEIGSLLRANQRGNPGIRNRQTQNLLAMQRAPQFGS